MTRIPAISSKLNSGSVVIIGKHDNKTYHLRVVRNLIEEEQRTGTIHTTEISVNKVLNTYTTDIKMSEEAMFEICRLYLRAKHGTDTLQETIEFK